MDATEEWREIAGHEGLYTVSSLGRVHSTRSGRYLKPGTAGRGYATVSLYRGDGIDTRTVHRLVAEAFLGPKPLRLDTCHNNGDLRDNRAANLRYATRNANMRDALIHGTHQEAVKTHCVNGHSLAPENVYIRRTVASDGGLKLRRCCKACQAAASARYRASRAA